MIPFISGKESPIFDTGIHISSHLSMYAWDMKKDWIIYTQETITFFVLFRFELVWNNDAHLIKLVVKF